jgi:hypothetical protein
MIRDFGRQAETMGLDSIWMGEHVALFDKNTYGYPSSRDGRIPVPDGLWRSHILLVQSLLVSRLMYRFSDPVLKGGSSWWNGLGRLAISGMRGERPSARN